MTAARNAFTLIELLIVVSLVTVITGAVLPSFNNYIDKQYVNQAREQVKDDLRTLQNKALNGERALDEYDGTKVEYWGVRFENESANYQTFVSVETNADACEGEYLSERVSSLLPGGNVIKNSDAVCVFFDFSNGDAVFYPSGPTSLTIIIGQPEAEDGECSRLQINSNGMIKAVSGNDCT